METWIDMSKSFPMRFDTQRMREEIKSMEDGHWLDHYDKGLSKGWKAIPLVALEGRVGDSEAQRPGTFNQFKRTPLLDRLPYFQQVLDAFQCPQGRIRIMKLMPGCGIGEHRDVGMEVANLAFRRVRLHIPIQTNPDVVFLVDGERIHMQEGGLYYVNFSKRHSVRNDGKEVRIHLVMDLEVNEWLAGFLPSFTLADRIAGLAQRAALPLFWKMRWWKASASISFWRMYEGSHLQRIRHGRLRT